MCAIIITASKLKVTYVAGLNPLSQGAEDTSSDEMKVLEEEIEQMKDEHNNGIDRIWTNMHIQRHGGTNVCDMQQ
jgi:hypothetical protein